jgi:hypothetical protein
MRFPAATKASFLVACAVSLAACGADKVGCRAELVHSATSHGLRCSCCSHASRFFSLRTRHRCERRSTALVKISIIAGPPCPSVSTTCSSLLAQALCNSQAKPNGPLTSSRP